MTLATYIDQLVTQAAHSTVPALIFPQFIEGATPISQRLDSLAAFAATQQAYYTAMGVSNPDLGPYEALGLGFSDTSQFNQKYGSLGDTAFISQGYVDAFCVYAELPQRRLFTFRRRSTTFPTFTLMSAFREMLPTFTREGRR